MEVEVEGPVLPVLEGPEPVEDEGLGGRCPGAKPLVEEEAVSPEPLGLVLDGGVGGIELAGDLAIAGATDEAPEEGPQKLGTPQPVGRGEGL